MTRPEELAKTAGRRCASGPTFQGVKSSDDYWRRIPAGRWCEREATRHTARTADAPPPFRRRGTRWVPGPAGRRSPCWRHANRTGSGPRKAPCESPGYHPCRRRARPFARVDRLAPAQPRSAGKRGRASSAGPGTVPADQSKRQCVSSCGASEQYTDVLDRSSTCGRRGGRADCRRSAGHGSHIGGPGRECNVTTGPTANGKVVGHRRARSYCRDFLHKSNPTLIGED